MPSPSAHSPSGGPSGGQSPDCQMSNAQLSALERMPIELRQEVYSHLGFPVLKQIEIPCPNHTDCADPNHWTADRWGNDFVDVHDPIGAWADNVEVVIRGYIFYDHRLSFSPLRMVVEYEGRLYVEPYPDDSWQVLLKVTKFVRDDILSHIFWDTEVRFNNCEAWTSLDNVAQPSRPAHNPVILPMTLKHMTKIRITPTFDSYPNGLSNALAMDISFLQLVSKACPQLTSLTYIPVTQAIVSSNPASVQGLCNAFLQIGRSCKHLQFLSIGSGSSDVTLFNSGNSFPQKVTNLLRPPNEWEIDYHFDPFEFELEGICGAHVDRTLDLRGQTQDQKERSIEAWSTKAIQALRGFKITLNIPPRSQTRRYLGPW